jgi:hypothetical protein
MNAQERRAQARIAAGIDPKPSRIPAMVEWLEREWAWFDDPANLMATDWLAREDRLIARIRKYERQCDMEAG